ncbi:hypothetical protein LOD99_16140 [Oopsacas minuta]|uniref:Uncharacterized protein n=1 Tax=Oopsacas minuta TaxID=111878 RepID=A0AAV7K6B8_9METZ|nr:hypothetical protein LOD99_16140 [Oopsacas minuta]
MIHSLVLTLSAVKLALQQIHILVSGDSHGLPDIPYYPPSPPRHYTAPIKNALSPTPPPPSRTLPNRDNTPVYTSVGVIKPLYPMAVRANTSWVKRYQQKLKTSCPLTQARIESSLDK